MVASRLGDNADIVMGQSPSGETCNTTGIGLPLLNGPTEYGPHHPLPVQFTTDARKRARRGDVLFCVRGSTTGRMNWADREYAIGRGVAAIRHKKNPALQPLVRAVIDYGLPGLLAQATGSTFPNVSGEQLAELWWPALTEDDERAIAHILGTLDDKIELNGRMNGTLEATARALFSTWLGGLDALRVPTSALIQAQILEIGDGYRAKNSELGAPGLPFIRAGDLNNGFDTTGADILHKESAAKAGRKISRVGDIAFTSKGTIGRFARVTDHTPPLVYSPQICYWRSLDFQKLHPTILYCWMQSNDLRDQILAVAGQTDMAPYVSLQDQRQMTMPVFPESQHIIARQIEPLLARQSSNVAENRFLSELHDTLLPKLVSGALRVTHANKFIVEPGR